MPNLKGWEIVIILVLLLLLFGAKRLPDAARGLGRSLRIFKSETRGLRDDDRDRRDDDRDPREDAAPRQLEGGSEPRPASGQHETAAPRAADPESRER